MKQFIKNNYICIIICSIISLLLSIFLANTYNSDYQLAILNENDTHYLSIGTQNSFKKEINKYGNLYSISLDEQSHGINAQIQYRDLDNIFVNNEKVETYKIKSFYSSRYDKITYFNIKNENKKTPLVYIIIFLILDTLTILIFKDKKYRYIFNKEYLNVVNKKHILISFILVLLTIFFVTGGDAAVIINVSNWFSKGINIYQLQVNSKNLLDTVYAEFPYNPISLFVYGGVYRILYPIMKSLPLIFNYAYLHIFLIKIINWIFINITVLSLINYLDKQLKLSKGKKLLLYYLSILNPITFYVAFIFVQIDALSLFLLTLGFINLPEIRRNNYIGVLLVSIALIIKMQLFILIPIFIISVLILAIDKKDLVGSLIRLIKSALIFIIIGVLFYGIHFVLKTPYYLMTSTLQQSERIYYTIINYMGTISLMVSVLLIGLAIYNYAFKMRSTIKEFELTKINLIYMLVMVFLLSASIVPTPSIYVLSLPAFIVIFALEDDWYKILVIYIMSIAVVLLPMLSDYGDITFILSLDHSKSLLMTFLKTLSDQNYIKFYNILFSISTVSMIAYSLLGINMTNKILDDDNNFEKDNLQKEEGIIKNVLELYKKYEEIVNYLIIGVLTTLVNLISKYILLFFIFDASNAKELQISIIISWIVAVLFAFITNRKIVFKSKSSKIIIEFIKFIEARLATLFVEMVYMWFFVTALKLDTKFWVLFWTLTCQMLIIILNYIFSKLFVFKRENK